MGYHPEWRPSSGDVEFHLDGSVPASTLKRYTQRVSHSKDWSKTPGLSWLHLKEEMGRRQCKNSSNNLKDNMSSPESRDSEIRTIVHPTPEELEEIYSKVNYMKIIEDLKQELKICHKQLEMTNKKVEEMNKSLKDTQENQEKQEKAIKQVREVVQDFKNEMEVMKKTQT